MTIIMTQPAAGGGSSTFHADRRLYQIPPTVDQAVDSVDMNSVIVVKWLVSIRDITNNQTCAFEVLSTHNDSIPVHNIHNHIGPTLPIEVRVFTNGSFLILELTNKHDEVVEVRVQNLTMQR
jgi:hypothetical protein